MNKVVLPTRYIGGIKRSYRFDLSDHFWWMARSRESHQTYGFDVDIGINNLLIGEI